MLELINNTQYKVGLFPGWDQQRKFQMTMVAKITYNFDDAGELTLSEKQSSICDVDEYRDNPLNSSLINVNETAAYKQGSEMYCYSTAYPPGKKTQVMEVGVGIIFKNQTEWKKVLRIYGDRIWNKTLLKYVMSNANFINKPIPITYENAYGGQHPDNDDYQWSLNPIGVGFNHSSFKLLSDKLPNIELGPNFITSPLQKSKPAGFAPIPLFWEPRASSIGTINDGDDDTINSFASNDNDGSNMCPYGIDALPTLHHVSPEDQWFDQPFIGGEIIHLRGLMKNVAHHKTVKLILPEIKFSSYSIIDNAAEWIYPVCDTLILNTDDNFLSLIYRGSILWDNCNVKQSYVIINDLSADDEFNMNALQ